MNSKIEQMISEIEEYIESCKPRMFSGSTIVVDKETMEELLTELRLKTPEEIKRYQKIISQKEAILADANAKAQQMLLHAEEMQAAQVSEHEIMQQAYAKANEVVSAAKQQAQEIYDNAVRDADEIRLGAISYTDELLKNTQDVLSRSIETTRARTDHLLESLQEYLTVVMANRSELAVPQQAGAETGQPGAAEEMELNIPYSTDQDAFGE